MNIKSAIVFLTKPVSILILFVAGFTSNDASAEICENLFVPFTGELASSAQPEMVPALTPYRELKPTVFARIESAAGTETAPSLLTEVGKSYFLYLPAEAQQQVRTELATSGSKEDHAHRLFDIAKAVQRSLAANLSDLKPLAPYSANYIRTYKTHEATGTVESIRISDQIEKYVLAEHSRVTPRRGPHNVESVYDLIVVERYLMTLDQTKKFNQPSEAEIRYYSNALFRLRPYFEAIFSLYAANLKEHPSAAKLTLFTGESTKGKIEDLRLTANTSIEQAVVEFYELKRILFKLRDYQRALDNTANIPHGPEIAETIWKRIQVKLQQLPEDFQSKISKTVGHLEFGKNGDQYKFVHVKP